ncbi:MAG: hypothetical protein KGD59_03875 [Candidatus Heimdallarchaeota archaeon]|nr:hypothetical protein [Candidatus Heimdallarchaeota archaeon]MBY8993663.1 hypothetical protein [Candidatus Heimdallarchaeota archaeon]
MSKLQETKKIQIRSKTAVDDNPEHLLEDSAEIKELINSPDFIEFVQTLSNTIDDKTTFDEVLSSRVILQKALAVLKKLKDDSL